MKPIYDRSYAVVIGINKYANPREEELDNAVSDAKAIAELLAGLQFDVIHLFDQDAKKDAIRSLIFDDLPSKVGNDDRVLVFFAGHATALCNKGNNSRTGFIMPHDGYGNKISTLIDFKELVPTAANQLAAKHILFIFDCCFSGIAAHLKFRSGHSKITSYSVQEYLQTCISRKAVQIITAGDPEQLVLDGSTSGHSPFTNAIINGIKNWEADEEWK